MTNIDEKRDALARVLDPEAWELFDDERTRGKKFRQMIVMDSRALATSVIESGLMASHEWDRKEYFTARMKILDATSRRGHCYGVEDGLDGYCKHDPRCTDWPDTATGPNSGCIK